MNPGRPVPFFSSALAEDAISFCTEVIDSSGAGEGIESLLAKKTGRPRCLKVRAVLVALLLLAVDDRPLHIKAVAKLLFLRLPATWRAELGIKGDASGRKAFLARYRQVRYLFHLVLAVIDPSVEPKDRVLPEKELAARRKKLTEAEVAARQKALEKLVADLLEASVKVCSREELAGFDGSVGLDATPVPLWSRGPSARRGTAASDPDGGWYIREGDHREGTGPDAKALRKIYWALEATIVTMGRPPGSVPAYPNLALGLALGKPGEDPGGTGALLLAQVRSRGWPAKYLGADRGYTQCRPEHFHLPVRALGYSLVMDYKAAELGRQANSQGALMVDGAFYCPALPEDLITASADKRAGKLDDAMYKARTEARLAWRLAHKQGPTVVPQRGDQAAAAIKRAGGNNTSSGGSARSAWVPSSRSCTSAGRPISDGSTCQQLSGICSGPKISSRQNASSRWPEASSTTQPSTSLATEVPRTAGLEKQRGLGIATSPFKCPPVPAPARPRSSAWSGSKPSPAP